MIKSRYYLPPLIMRTNKMRSKQLLQVLLILSLFFALSPAYAKQTLDKIIAVVNSDVISQNELDNYTRVVIADLKSKSDTALPPKSVLQEQLLNRMVMDKIQLQLAEQSGIEVDSISVSEALQQIARSDGKSMEQFKRDIESSGISFDEYRNLIRTELILQRLQAKEIAQHIVISKSDVEAFLSSPSGQDQSGTEYRLSHILILTPDTPTPNALKETQTKAEEVVANLKSGADFAKTAMTKSAGRQALNGGDLGWRTTGELPTLFVNYVPSMKVGEVVGPIRSAGGFHIIKLQDKRLANSDKRTETHVRQILIVPDQNTSSDEAKAVLAKLRYQLLNGEDFAKVAQQKSQDARTAAKGGDLGWVNEQNVLPKFYQVMSKLRNNEISEPFLTEEGWNIIQVLDRRTQHTSNEAAWNRASEMLTMRKFNEALEAWSKRIRDEARVTVLLPGAKDKQA